MNGSVPSGGETSPSVVVVVVAGPAAVGDAVTGVVTGAAGLVVAAAGGVAAGAAGGTPVEDASVRVPPAVGAPPDGVGPAGVTVSNWRAPVEPVVPLPPPSWTVPVEPVTSLPEPPVVVVPVGTGPPAAALATGTALCTAPG